MRPQDLQRLQSSVEPRVPNFSANDNQQIPGGGSVGTPRVAPATSRVSQTGPPYFFLSFFFFLILIDLAAPGLSCSGQDLQSMEPVIKVTDLEFCTKATEAEPCTQVILEMTEPHSNFCYEPPHRLPDLNQVAP